MDFAVLMQKGYKADRFTSVDMPLQKSVMVKLLGVWGGWKNGKNASSDFGL